MYACEGNWRLTNDDGDWLAHNKVVRILPGCLRQQQPMLLSLLLTGRINPSSYSLL
jgi:hypothetical protein